MTLINPSGEPSVHDNLWHIVDSTNSGADDFKYVFDIFIGADQVVRVKQFPEPSNQKGYFDAGPIVRNYFSYDWFTPVRAFPNNTYLVEPNASGQISLEYQIRAGEEYSGVTYINEVSGITRAYNWVPPLYKRRQGDSTSFLNRYFSNRPRVIYHALNEKLMIPIKTDATLQLKCDTYDFNNTLIESRTQAGSYANAGYLQLDIGSIALNATIGSEQVNEQVKYYDVWFNSFEKIRVYLECDHRYDPVLLFFVNHWGMFDTYRFGLVSKLQMDLERKDFSKRDYNFGASSVDYYDANNVYAETKINYGTKKDWTLKLTSSPPTDAEYEWLQELIDSPQIFMEKDGDFYPVTIKNTSYEYTQQRWAGLKAFELEINVNQKRNGFLR